MTCNIHQEYKNGKCVVCGAPAKIVTTRCEGVVGKHQIIDAVWNGKGYDIYNVKPLYWEITN